MKKFFKRLSILCMSIVMLCNNSLIVNAAERDTAISIQDIGLEEAENVAVLHIQNIIASNKESAWKKGVKINTRKALFNLDEEIVAYYFGLVNKQGNPNGYIITGACSNVYPLLEYAEEGESFINVTVEATEEIIKRETSQQIKDEHTKVYYLGGMSYAVEHTLKDNTDIMYDVTSSNITKIDKKEIKEIKHKKKSKDYSNDWLIYSKKDCDGGSTPPNSKGDGYISEPAKYETGFTSERYHLIPEGDRKYSVMTEFSNGGVCAPTAGINLCKYWYYRDYDYDTEHDRQKWDKLKKNDSWTYSFWLMYECMQTKEDGTYRKNIANGYKKYFEYCGLSCTAYISEHTDNGKNIVTELHNNRPVHLSMHDHYYYGDHSVIAVGYRQYTYHKWYGDTYSTYIRIVDGWTAYPTRYVWGGCSGDWAYITVIPN